MNRYNQAKDKKSAWRGILGTAVLIALASVGWLYFKNQQSGAVTGAGARVLALPLVSGETAEPISVNKSVNEPDMAETIPDGIVELHLESSFILPDLDNSDALIREEITGISPMLADWLNTDQLVRKYIVIINDLSQGWRLEKHLGFAKPGQPFTVDQDKGSPVIAAKSYQRYDRLAAAINALDVQATLTVYKKFRPLLLQVFSEFSYPAEYSLGNIFTKAAAIILAAPIVDGQIALVRHSANYKFADRQLESLNPVHKQMLRMGPENTRIIQDKLRLLVAGLVNLEE